MMKNILALAILALSISLCGCVIIQPAETRSSSSPTELSSDGEALRNYEFVTELEFDEGTRLVAIYHGNVIVYRPDENLLLIVNGLNEMLVDQIEMNEFEPSIGLLVEGGVYFFQQLSPRDKASYSREPRIAYYDFAQHQMFYASLDERFSPLDIAYVPGRELILAIDAYTDSIVTIGLNDLQFDDGVPNYLTRNFLYEIRPRSIVHAGDNVVLISDRDSNVVYGFYVDGLKPLFDFYKPSRAPISSLTITETGGEHGRPYLFGIEVGERDPSLVAFDLGQSREGVVNFNDNYVLGGTRRYVTQAEENFDFFGIAVSSGWFVLPHDGIGAVLVGFEGSESIGMYFPRWNELLKEGILYPTEPLLLTIRPDNIVGDGHSCIAAGNFTLGVVELYCLQE